MPGRSERGDVEAALAESEVRVEVAYRWPPTTTTRSRRRPRRRLGRRPADPLRLDDGHPREPADGRAPARAAAGRRPGDHALRRRRLGSKAMAGRTSPWPRWRPHVGRPVRLALTRPQPFTSHGHREEQEQPLKLGATRDGRLTAIRHHKLSITSPFDDWAEPATGVSSQLYTCPNYEGVHRLVRGNTMTPTFTRGPGVDRRVRARDGDGRARLRGRARSGGAARAQPLGGRRARERVVQRRPGGVPAGGRRAVRLGRARPGPGSAATATGWSAPGWPPPRTRSRCSCRRSAPTPASTPTAAPSCRPAPGVRDRRHDRDDAGRRRRPRRGARRGALRVRRHRPAEHVRRGRLGRRRHGQRRGARAPSRRCASSSSRWRSRTPPRRCTAPIPRTSRCRTAG